MCKRRYGQSLMHAYTEVYSTDAFGCVKMPNAASTPIYFASLLDSYSDLMTTRLI